MEQLSFFLPPWLILSLRWKSSLSLLIVWFYLLSKLNWAVCSVLWFFVRVMVVFKCYGRETFFKFWDSSRLLLLFRKSLMTFGILLVSVFFLDFEKCWSLYEGIFLSVKGFSNTSILSNLFWADIWSTTICVTNLVSLADKESLLYNDS